MSLKIMLVILLINTYHICFAQNVNVKSSIWTVDYVKAKEGQLADLLEFFRLNWQAARVHAKKAKYIEDYKWYILPEATDYQVVLMTKYKNAAQYDQREEHFQKIFAKYKPKPILVHGKSSSDMREIVKSENFYEPDN